MATIRSTFTAGAVPVRNAKGELSMQKVKVTRYVAGKKPEYAPELDYSSDEEDAEHALLELSAKDADDADYRDENTADHASKHANDLSPTLEHASDDGADQKRRLARLLKTRESSSESDEDDERSKTIGKRYERKSNAAVGADVVPTRKIAKPEIVSDSTRVKGLGQRVTGIARFPPSENRELNDDDEIDADNDRDRLRRMLRQKVDAQKQVDLLTAAVSSSKVSKDVVKSAIAGDASRHSASRSATTAVSLAGAASFYQHQNLSAMSSANVAANSEDESEESGDEDNDDEEDNTRPRLKPVFVRRKDRLTRVEEEQAARRNEQEQKRLEVDRQKEAQRMVQQAVRRDIEEQQQLDARNVAHRLDAAVPDLPVIDDAVEEEAEYEAWRVRELERIKRDRDEREKWRLEQAEQERLREMSNEERERELASRPKQPLNKPEKGRMRFMQRYYHRGVFYLNKEEKVLQRDVTAPTLEDQFDRAAMPSVLQVKNFGKSGRSKWTHLTAEDTSRPDAAWSEMSQLNRRFMTDKSGGSKQIFERPSGSNHKRKNERE